MCGLHFGGITLASLELLIKCANQGAKRANAVVKQIKAALESDDKCRQRGEHVGFMQSLQSTDYSSHNADDLRLRLPFNPTIETRMEFDEANKEQAKIKALGRNSAVLMTGEEQSSEDEYDDFWIADGDVDSETTLNVVTSTNKIKEKVVKESEDSEEEETVLMEQIT